jgi:hypothetical protein
MITASRSAARALSFRGRIHVIVFACLGFAACRPFPFAAPVAPEGSARTAWWGGVGAGLGAASPGFVAQAELNRQRGGPLLRARVSDFEGFSSWGNAGEAESLQEMSVLIGGGTPCCHGHWGGWALGAGVVTGSSGSAPERKIRTAGLSGDAFLISGRAPHFSFGVGGNLNPQRSFATISVSLLLGRMPFLTTPAPPRRLPSSSGLVSGGDQRQRNDVR